MNEADTCTKYVVPKLVEAGWDNDPHSFTEQRSFTDGRIIPLGNKVRRGKQKRADYLLRYRRDFPIAIVEAKADYKTPAAGWRSTKGELDRYGREIPDDEYHTKDFERAVALRARTEAIAKHLTDFMKANDHFAKTIVFCVDQEHAGEMRQMLNNLNQDLAQQHPDYVCRVTNDEDDIGKGHRPWRVARKTRTTEK
jgi:type I site-specific restriction endonuclease